MTFKEEDNQLEMEILESEQLQEFEQYQQVNGEVLGELLDESLSLDEEEFNESDSDEEDVSSSKKKKKKGDKLSDFYLKKINDLEVELAAYKAREQSSRDELNKKYLENIQKKTEDAKAWMEEKEKQMEQKYILKLEELEEHKNFMYEDQLTELVNIISGMEKVINSEPRSEEVKNYLLGFKMFLTQFESLLESLNIKVISPQINEEYDSEKMESVMTEGVEEEKKNKIIEVFSKGYTLNDRVIKLAQVKVGV
ncbi:Co-chaperone GrpE [Mycoplasma suis KI3806]|uniref:Protein GrpE n=1 Tax=Mycoplasma suis (strain KI_3806) TaxID=708248 RepID=F0V1H5_MYCS3|nr:nucleotide exchange factor GrpE [Mycoplasma suis]CBZ40506.1 Co-chaperone GrpE [Mycoplasma suis KI3806]